MENNSNNKNIFIGLFFTSTHILIVYIAIFVAIFSNNFFVLYSLGLIILFILFLNHLYHDCPISLLEDYHLDFSSVDYGNSFLPINYNKNRRSEVTLQWILMALVIVLVKILVLFLIKTLKDMKIIK